MILTTLSSNSFPTVVEFNNLLPLGRHLILLAGAIGMRGLTTFSEFSLPDFLAAPLRSFSGLPTDFSDDELRTRIHQFYQQYIEHSSCSFRDDISESY